MTATDELGDLRARFAEDVRLGFRELAALGYDATLFRLMVAELGAIAATEKLVLVNTPSYGLWRLQQLGRLDMSREMWGYYPGMSRCSARW